MPRLAVTALAALAVLASSAPLAAQDTTAVRIGIRYDPSQRPGVLVLPIAGVVGDSLRIIIQRDLDYGDRVVVITPDAALAATLAAGGSINYPLLAKLGASRVVQGTMTPRGLHVALHDVAKAQVTDVAEFPLPIAQNTRDWRAAVHGVSDQVEAWISGTQGIARTRVAFIRGSVVRMIDSDGEDDQAIPMLGEAMSPAWSPSGAQLLYTTFGVNSRVVLHDLTTGRARAFGQASNTTNLTATFSPDGSSIVWAAAGENGSDLFLMPVSLDAPARRITVGRGTDNVQPTFSPDGRRLAFMSSRAGHPEIYIMDADGTNTDLLTVSDFGDQNYRSSPEWSPDDRQVAFQSRISGKFQVLVIGLRDRTSKLLTSDGENKDPSWSPDGRHLVFTSNRSGTSQLWILDTETGRTRQLTHTAGSRLASWSPRLKP
ncbi:MAG: WD40-like beta Propeller containing protein [Gemmatimonadetes bacterium]|nr:WD40-like beta Propeller containing protein [Gemmatimonadota bacterium]